MDIAEEWDMTELYQKRDKSAYSQIPDGNKGIYYGPFGIIIPLRDYYGGADEQVKAMSLKMVSPFCEKCGSEASG